MQNQTLYRIAKILITLSLGIMTAGVYVGFLQHELFSLQAQVAAHISIMLGAIILKLSYVLHLNTSKHLKINEFAEKKVQPSGIVPSEAFVPECCLTGTRCM